MLEIARKSADEDVSDMCVKAFEQLKAKGAAPEHVDILIVVTQNPDFNIPHSSAIVHGKLALNEDCACFDISLGCSGFVYALSVIEATMVANGFNTGLLFTADPYSKVVNPEDKNTSLLFGDAAAVTLINNQPFYTAGKYQFGTRGKHYRELICRDNHLYMNGRAIFNFTAKTIPGSISKVLEINDLSPEEVDKYLFHQGSKFIVDTLTKRINLAPEKVVFGAGGYGNTVSSSIPILLEKEMADGDAEKLVICGFGVGLSWASTVLHRQG